MHLHGDSGRRGVLSIASMKRRKKDSDEDTDSPPECLCHLPAPKGARRSGLAPFVNLCAFVNPSLIDHHALQLSAGGIETRGAGVCR